MDKIDNRIERLKKQLQSALKEKKEKDNLKYMELGQLVCVYYKQNKFDITDVVLKEKIEAIMCQS